jgi:hypothetical protein
MADGLVIFTFAITARNSHNVLNLHRATSTSRGTLVIELLMATSPTYACSTVKKQFFFFDPGKVRVITRISVSGRLIP